MSLPNPFSQRAPIHMVPPGYQEELDRLPPRENKGCLRVVGFSALGIGVVALLVLVLTRFAASQQTDANTTEILMTPSPTASATLPPTETLIPAPTATLDGWSLTGTAIAESTATMTPTATASPDYCWFLTPSPTPSNTPIVVTLDPWQLTGTAVYLETGTPSPTPTATRPSPRAWCDLQTPSMTPFPLLGRRGTAEVTDEVGDWMYLESPTLGPTFTRTLLPPIRLSTDVPPVQPTSVIPYVPPTSAPPPVQPTNPPPIQYATATWPPTSTYTYTPTETHTVTPSPTFTYTATETATEIPTATPTATYTETFTPSPTWTPSETPSLTPTFTATALPALAVIGASCANHYPSFAVQNFGTPVQLALWEIRQGELIAATGYWQPPELGTGAFANASAPAWINVPGTYQLIIYQTWDAVIPYQSAFVVCAAPTAPPTATATPTETSTPTATPTIEAAS